MPKKRKSPSSGAARRTVASKTSSAPDDDAEQPVLRADPQTAAAPTKRQRLTSAGRDAHTGVHSRAPGGGNGSGYAGEQLRAGEEVVVEFWVGSGRHHLQPELFTGKVSRSLPQNSYQVAFDDGDVRTVHARMIRRPAAGGAEPQTSYVSQPTPRSLETCAICLSAFKDLPLDAPTIRLSRCRHSFCEECINSWWSSSSSKVAQRAALSTLVRDTANDQRLTRCATLSLRRRRKNLRSAKRARRQYMRIRVTSGGSP